MFKNGIKYSVSSQWSNMRIESYDYESKEYPGTFRLFWSDGASGVPSDLSINQKNEIESILENHNPLEIFNMVIDALESGVYHILLETLDEKILNTIRKTIR